MQAVFHRDHAPSGIPGLPSLSWGSHLCQTFGSAEDLRNLLVPYFKAGLENNERCLWVADAPLSAEQAREALAEVVPDLGAREAGGQIEIRDTDAFYDRGAPLQPAAIVAGLIRREQEALAAGFQGLRTNGNCAWVDRLNFSSFLDYESAVHASVPGRRLICMCSYSHDCLEPLEATAVMERHHLVLPGPRGQHRHEDAPAKSTGMTVPEPDAEAFLSEQSIAILGHDLRNPLAAIAAGAKLLRRRGEDAGQRAIAEKIERSADHMAALVNDLLDVSRMRFGDAVSLRRTRDDLAEALSHAVEELRLTYPDRQIDVQITIDQPVLADRLYMARMLSNLLKNALTHGSPDHPVTVKASTEDVFALSVANTGTPIAAATRERLFSPFIRGSGDSDRLGLGLGLFIVAEIARAHKGQIELTSDEDATCFTFQMPLG